MRLFRGVNRLLAVQLLLLAAGLGVLATLQYRWLQRVANAERGHIRENLSRAAERLDEALSGEIRRAFQSFLAPEDAEVAPLYEAWLQNAPYPALVSGVYVAQRNPDDTWSLQQLDLQTYEIVPRDWPPLLAVMRKPLDELAARGPNPPWPNPMFASIPGLFIVQLPARGEMSPMLRKPQRVIALQFDRTVLARTILPSLVARDFAGNKGEEYDVALVAGKEVFYQSSAAWPDGRTAADVTRELIPISGLGGPRRMEQGGRPGPPWLYGPPAQQRREKGKHRPPREGTYFRLSIRQGEGGLEAIVASTQRRNLAVSVGILGVLGATVVTLLALLRRGEHMRLQQAQFVAAISHELNTPLTALRIVGENLEQGMVQDREKLIRYARTIVKESTRLSDLINQVLELSGMRARTPSPVREAVDVRTVIDDAVASCRLLTDGDIHFEVAVDSDLPPVAGRSLALTRAVQNLVSNAIRHAGAGKWVGIRAARNNGGVRITVEDRGPGIDSSDAAHLFEPFYRGRNSGAVRGAGLGLTIVREIVADHGGSIEIDGRRKEGAAFSIQLPVRAHVG
ncbi:MAG TPA: HAMP domain-containing sensor histidine kinase [Thermoanaerobaculia bacterium]|nr:HAMP domain-containing sensor histidine kinase [Thermoanaerobaculia bacterium]